MTIAWIRTDSPGISDDAVLARAHGDGRVLLTFDQDFGELVLKRVARASHGVIPFRIPLSLPLATGQVVVRAIASRTEWQGHFSVVEVGRVRMRALAP